MPNYTNVQVSGRAAVKFYGGGDYNWVTPSVPLTEAANNYTGGQTLLAPVVMPYMGLPFGSAVIPSIGRGDYRAENLQIAPATEAQRYQFNLESKRAYIDHRGIKTSIDLEVEKDSADDWKWRENVTVGLAGLLNASLEKMVWDAVNVATNVASTWTVKSAFTGAGDSMTAVLGLLSGVQGISGFRPDIISFGYTAWPSFSANSSVIARCGGWVTPARVAEVLRVNTVAVHDGQYNSVSNLPPVFTPFQTADTVAAFCTKGPRWGVRPYWAIPGVPSGPIYTEQLHDGQTRRNFIECGIWTKETVVDATLAGTLLGVNSSQTGGL